MADLEVNVEQLGVTLGVITLGPAAIEVEFTCVNRLQAEVQALAFSVAGASVAFLFCQTVSGVYVRIPAGGGINLPVSGTQSWFFKEDASSAGAELQVTCAG